MKIKSNIIQNINPVDIIEHVKKILNLSSTDFMFDVLISNTPPKTSDYTKESIKEWGLVSLKLINFLSFNKVINKTILLGSCLSFVPFLRSGIYKAIKKIEFNFFYELHYYKSSKLAFCILPPLSPGVDGIGVYFAQSQEYWGKKIMNAFNFQTSIIIPNGLIGLILKLIFIMKFKKI